MRLANRCLAPVLILVFTANAPRLDAQQHEGQARRTAARDTSGYSTQQADFVVGKHVHLRSTKTLIGRITAVDSNRAFPSSFPRPRMKAVKIERAGGITSWVPMEGITRIYVTR